MLRQSVASTFAGPGSHPNVPATIALLHVQQLTVALNDPWNVAHDQCVKLSGPAHGMLDSSDIWACNSNSTV